MLSRDVWRLGDDQEELLEAAWGLIANAGGGDWSQETEEWQDAAKRWRDQYHQAEIPVAVESELLRLAVADLTDGEDSIEVPAELMRGLVAGLTELQQAIGGCDHSVGICGCEQTDRLEQLKLALVGEKFCPDCGGDGVDWNTVEPRTCPRCDGKGKVAK
jgi:hypothetical protein